MMIVIEGGWNWPFASSLALIVSLSCRNMPLFDELPRGVLQMMCHANFLLTKVFFISYSCILQPPGSDYAQFVGIYDRMVRDRILFIGNFIDEENANSIISSILY